MSHVQAARLDESVSGRDFGAPAHDLAARIRAASVDDLDRWTDRILDANTLADVLAE